MNSDFNATVDEMPSGTELDRKTTTVLIVAFACGYILTYLSLISIFLLNNATPIFKMDNINSSNSSVFQSAETDDSIFDFSQWPMLAMQEFMVIRDSVIICANEKRTTFLTLMILGE